jgi:type I restriction enzyme R subunit
MSDKAHLEATLESLISDQLVNNGWILGSKDNYDRGVGIDRHELFAFLEATQDIALQKLFQLHGNEDKAKQKFIDRLVREIENNGIIHVLRKGITDLGVKINLAYFKPENFLSQEGIEEYEANRVTITRQIKMSETNVNDSIDLTFLLNGLPIATAELKAQTAGQNVKDAMKQYRFDRKPNDLIFSKRSLVNFAIDENDVFMTTKLQGASTVFLPFNQGTAGGGNAGGKGNPLDPNGEKTRYFWHEVLQRDNWLRIIGSYVHLAFLVDENTGKKSGEKVIVFPRFHQWHAVESLLSKTLQTGPGVNRLAQHSAGSGKSNTISWLAHRLSVLHTPHKINSDSIWEKGFAEDESVFDKVIVVTDRRVLDQQLRDTVSSFDHQPGSIVSIREDMGSKSGQLVEALKTTASRIIITTIQTFPVIAETAVELKGTRFAVIVDEAHSGQSGDTAKDLKLVLGGNESDSLEKAEEFDSKNALVDMSFDELLERSLKARGKAENITFFAFTATPRSKTLEMFGERITAPNGEEMFIASHQYSMRQAIEEQYILDVLTNYTTYKTYYRLANNLGSGDLELPKGKAAAALARFASLHPTNLSQKAEIIVEHFRANTAHKINGKAKAMVVTRSRLHAVRYKQAIDNYIKEKNYSDVRTLVAFSGTVFDPDNPSLEYTENSMNPIKGKEIPKEFAKSYQVLIVAEKFQTGFDQPLLHTMYVDKKLEGIAAVQTLSRLNRINPGKEDTFVLDFANDAEFIRESFKPYYESTTGTPTDPNILFDLKQRILNRNILHVDEIEKAVSGILKGNKEGSSMLKANTDPAVGRWNQLDEDDKIAFKGDCKKFVSAYSYMGQIVPFSDEELEKLYFYLKMLVRRLLLDDNTGGVDIDDSVVLTHLRTEIASQNEDLSLDQGTEEPLTPAINIHSSTGRMTDSELLSRLIEALNDRFGTNLTEVDRVWFEQQQIHHANNPELKEVAMANDYDNFAMFFEPKIETDLIERHEANEDLFKAFFNQPDFKKMMTDALSRSLYDFFNTSSSPK